MRFSDKAVIVTGAARGIGKGIAQRFAEEGARVLAFDLDDEPLAQTAAEFSESGWILTTVTGDVTKRADVHGAVEHCVEQFGGLDVMVAAAGILPLAHVLEIDDDTWERTIDVNLKGVFYCTQEAARAMASRGGGSIIGLGSVNAFWASNNNSHYCASKGAVVSFMRAAALDLGPLGIRVNTINPGLTNTRMGGLVTDDPIMGPQFLQGLPIKRFAEPVDIAKTAVFLASDEASYITGQQITVDGGFSVGTAMASEEAKGEAE